ncbi:MAG TPA: hypothetical protein PLZ84_00335 [Clostridia bacterium]|nr:hypothetical protein [Clostridia bacterium]
MTGFDEQNAVCFITERIYSSQSQDKEKIRKIIEKILAYDLEFMRNTGVIADDKFVPDVFYDDDEAFSYVADKVFKEFEDEDEQTLMDLLEGYFEYFEEYMDKNSMLEWE